MMRFLTSVVIAALLAISMTVAAGHRAQAEEFSILTYNAMMLDKKAFPNHRQNTRAKIIPGGLEREAARLGVRWDVVVFNEAFLDSARNALIAGMTSKGFRFVSSVPPSSGLKDDGGVFIMSRYPIVDSDTLTYAECSGVFGDCLAKKGVSYAKVKKNGKHYHVFATHLQANNDASDVEARKIQLIELSTFILGKAHTAPVNGERVIVAGDMNIDPTINAREYRDMLRFLQTPAPPSSALKPTLDPRVNDLAKWRYGGEPASTLDYVFAHNFGGQPTSRRYDIVKPKVARKRVTITTATRKVFVSDLSDHYGVSAVFRFGGAAASATVAGAGVGGAISTVTSPFTRPNLSSPWPSQFGPIHWPGALDRPGPTVGFYGEPNKTITGSLREDKSDGTYFFVGRWGRRDSNAGGALRFNFDGSGRAFSGWYESTDGTRKPWTGRDR